MKLSLQQKMEANMQVTCWKSVAHHPYARDHPWKSELPQVHKPSYFPTALGKPHWLSDTLRYHVSLTRIIHEAQDFVPLQEYAFSSNTTCAVFAYGNSLAVLLHGLLSGQEARMHGGSPHFSQMLWITASLRNPGGFPGCHRYSSVCSGAGCTLKSRAVAGQAVIAF